MTDSLFDGPVVFLDVETTGGNTGRNRIIEIGLVAARGGRLEYEWTTLVNPGEPIPLAIQHFTGITDEMVRHAPAFEDIAVELERHLEGRLFVAHNARFDYGFVRGELRRLGRRFASRVACTVKLSRKLYPELPRHNLDALVEYHGLHCDARHRALPDAQALWQFWQVLRARHPRDVVEAALLEVAQLRSLPPHLSPTLPDELPEGPGVYRFYGEGDALLYVGKATNVRSRVLAHWQGAMRDSKSRRLAELTRRIEWTETAGELGALLLEAQLVRELHPLYNRRLRAADEVWTWVVDDDGAAPRLEPLGQCQLSFSESDTFGLYRTERQARGALLAAAREHRLCLKILGLEDSRGSCFAFQLGKCAGACVGDEPLARHTARLKLALADERLKPWPFEGAVGIRETGPGGLEQLHVVDEWRYLGSIGEDEALPRQRCRAPFDLEAYRILTRWLGSRSRPRIVPLPHDGAGDGFGDGVGE